MRKIKVSFDGRNNNETWTIDQWEEIAEPNMVISRHSRTLSVTFESHREKERFNSGIALCRAVYMDGDIKHSIYLTSTIKL